MKGFGSNDYVVTGALCLNMSHGYGFSNSVGYPKSDSVGLLVYDSMCIYPGHWFCITSLSGQC
jgi:hypothetical protein